MAEEERSTNYWVQLLRKNAAERKVKELEKYGEAGFGERQKQIDIAIDATIERVIPIAAEALRRGFVYFRCDLDIMPTFALMLLFADGKGNFYKRSLGLERLVKKRLSSPSMMEYHDVSNAVHLYVRGLEGIKMLEHNMRRRRVSAKHDE